MTKTKSLQFAAGILVGAALFGDGATAAAGVLAEPSVHHIYVDGKQVQMTAFTIGGNNYVKLRDIGRAVDFGVTYDAATNSVYIDPDAHYVEESQPDKVTGNDLDPDINLDMEIRNEIIRLVNATRAAAGVDALAVNDALMDAAQICSAQGVSKHDPKFECETALACGYPYGLKTNLTAFGWSSLENIAKRAVTNWIYSPGHYETMTEARFVYIGAGVSFIGDRVYCYILVGDPNSINAYG